jgi:two-component system, sensor histidine kinase LadS
MMKPTVRGSASFLIMALFVAACFYAAFFFDSGTPRIPSASVAAVAPAGSGPIISRIAVLEDRPGKLGFDQVRSFSRARGYVPQSSSRIFRGITKSAFWIRFQLSGRFVDAADSFLEMDNPNLYEIELYLPVAVPGGGATYELRRMGQTTDVRDKGLLTRNWTVRLPRDLVDGEPVYLRVKSGTIVSLPLAVVDAAYVVRKTIAQDLVFGAFLGILLAMIFYNVLSFFIVRNTNYIFYVLYLVFMLVYQAKIHGYLYYLGIPYEAARILVWVSLSCAGFFSIQFSRTFFETKSRVPIIDFLMKTLIVVFVIQGVIGIAGYEDVANILAHVSGLLLPLAILVVAVVRYNDGFAPARYFLLGWMALFMGVSIWSISGFIPTRSLPWNYFLVLGTAMESIFFSVAISRLIRQLVEEKEHLAEQERIFRNLAHIDSLTGLYNKRYFTEKMAELRNCTPAFQFFSVLMLDLDFLKTINDSFGHQMGDRVLIKLAEKIFANVRKSDVPCRFGGDEFAVLLPGAGKQDAIAVAEKIRESFVREKFLDSSGEETGATVSVGVAALEPGEMPESLVTRADRALYEAKERGKNRIVAG